VPACVLALCRFTTDGNLKDVSVPAGPHRGREVSLIALPTTTIIAIRTIRPLIVRPD
jgi:hypothetical protein